MKIKDILAGRVRIEDVLDVMLQLDNPIGSIRGLIKGLDAVIFANPQYAEAYRNRGMAKLELSGILPAFDNPGAVTFDAIHDLQTSCRLAETFINNRFIQRGL